jgi:hypothetical protein
MSLSVQQSFGDVLDRITILEIKLERIPNAEKRAHAAKELQVLEQSWAAAGLPPELPERALLTQVNTQLWEVEDRLREREAAQDFGSEFVSEARSVYQINDKRAELKRRVNLDLGSDLVEVKSYHGDR